jgi:hypothetical protein
MRNKLMFGITVVMTGLIALIIYSLACGKDDIPVDTKHNIVFKFSGRDSQIPKDGELLIIQESREDTVIIGPATDDDCRRILENHGQG